MEQTYTTIFLTQLFQTLGTISAVVMSSALTVPMFSYYNRQNMLKLQKYIDTEMQAVTDRIRMIEELASEFSKQE
ncbi:hypothetical protein EBU95_02670 [bacterium]|nr:hypothetical protein [bacterium]